MRETGKQIIESLSKFLETCDNYEIQEIKDIVEDLCDEQFYADPPYVEALTVR